MNSIKTHFSNHKSVVTVAAALLGLAMGMPIAQAADLGEARTQHVAYSDLNIDSAGGAKVLYSRIRSAAKDVCSPLYSAELARRASFDGCVSTAVTTSVAQVNNSRVTALHDTEVKTSRKG